MKKILIINTTFNKGGAAQVANDLFENLKSDFEIYFAYGRGNKIAEAKTFYFGNKIEVFFHVFLVRFLGLDGFGSYFATKKLIKFIKKGKFDLIHIHNLHGYYVNFFTLVDFLGKSGIPVIWTLHDEWSITWMPAYGMGCLHCKTLEGKCTNFYKYPKTYNKLFSKFLLNKKRKFLFKKWNPVIVCPAEWIKKEVEENYFKKNEIKFICNGIDINTFMPLKNKEELKNKYNIPVNKKIVLFSISNIKDIRKGFNYIIETTERLINESVFFVGVGNSDIKATENIKPIGFISNKKSLVEIFNLADVFLYTSLVEIMPLTVIEAMACGLPVVAFNVQGVNELIDKDCGFLTEPGNVLGLDSNLNLLFKNDKMIKDMSTSAREKALNSLSFNKTLTEYKKLYINILNV
jgi:glycosyltransferase involved in cell wall biosynthesis